MRRRFLPMALALVWGCSGAAGRHAHHADYPPRDRGCAVRVLTDPGPTQNIGTVTALCTTEDTRDVCQRELLDQVCLLGGDAVWEVEGPALVDTQNGPRQRMRGRAVHTR